MTGYQALANAIILQAAKDYKAALKKHRDNPSENESKGAILLIEEFFHSPLYDILTGLNPDYLIKRIRREVA